MKIEKFHLKFPFETFKDKVMNYVISNYKNGGDMKPIFKKLEDPIKAMEDKHKPKNVDDATDQIEKDTLRKRSKKFVAREHVLRSNMEKCTVFYGDNAVQHYKPPSREQANMRTSLLILMPSGC